MATISANIRSRPSGWGQHSRIARMWEVPTQANPMAVRQALSTGKPIHGEPAKGIRAVPLSSTHAALLIAIVPLHSGLRLSGARKITGPTAPLSTPNLISMLRLKTPLLPWPCHRACSFLWSCPPGPGSNLSAGLTSGRGAPSAAGRDVRASARVCAGVGLCGWASLACGKEGDGPMASAAGREQVFEEEGGKVVAAAEV